MSSEGRSPDSPLKTTGYIVAEKSSNRYLKYGNGVKIAESCFPKSYNVKERTSTAGWGLPLYEQDSNDCRYGSASGGGSIERGLET